MKDSRIGESLWFIWDGDGYHKLYQDSTVYYTEDQVDIDNELVRKALASSMQRDGLVESLGMAFYAIDRSTYHYGYVGTLDDEHYHSVCTETGETYSGDILENVIPATWVEVHEF
jgi:hypothetical protein